MQRALLAAFVFSGVGGVALLAAACGDDDAAPGNGSSSTSSSSGGGGEGGASTSSSSSSGSSSSGSNDSGADGSSSGEDGGGDPNSFTLKATEYNLAEGAVKQYCVYMHTPNTAEALVKSWSSVVSPGVVRMSVVFTSADDKPVNTVSEVDCGLFSTGSNNPRWVYSAWTENAGWSFPADDGTGKPVARRVKAGQSAILVVYALNATSAPIKVNAQVTASLHPTGTAVTDAFSYVTYNGNISIPATQTGTATNTCPVPAGAKFNFLSTYAHKQATKMEVKDGANVLFSSLDWQKPIAQMWNAAPFGQAASNTLTATCDYMNPSNRTVTAGNHPEFDEQCTTLAYHFPATKDVMCLNNILLP